MAEKGFGIKELNIIGSAGTPLIESKVGLNIRVGTGFTVGIGTTGLSNWLTTKANADPDNLSTLNAGIVTANYYYGDGSYLTNVGSGTLSNIEIKQYKNNEDPRTERGCTNPIEVAVTGGLATIGIGSTSNAFGTRFHQTDDPTSAEGGEHVVCDGDLWFSDSVAGGGGGTPGGDNTQVQYNDSGVFGGMPHLTYGKSTGDVYFVGNGGNALLHNLEWSPSNHSLTFYNNTYLTIGTSGGNNWATRIYSDSAGGAIWSAAQGGGSISILGKDATTSHNITLKPNNSKDSIVATANAEVSLWYNGSKRFQTDTFGASIFGGSTVAGRLDLYEALNNGSNKISLQPPTELLADYTLTLPTDNGNPNQVLKTDGEGVLSWTNNAGGGGGTPGGSDKEVQFNDNNSFNGIVGLKYDKNANILTLTDDYKLRIGSGTQQYTEIYHQVSDDNTYIQQKGNADLYISASDRIFLRQGINENVLVGHEDGSADFCFDGSPKIRTNNQGVDIHGSPSLPGVIRIYEANGFNTNANYAELTVPATLTANYTLTLPADAGDSNEVLTTDGAGILSWTTKGGSGSGSPQGSDKQIQYNDNGSFGGATYFTYIDTDAYPLGVGDVVFSGASGDVFWDRSANRLTAKNDAGFAFGQLTGTNNYSTSISGDGNGHGYWDASGGTGDIYIRGSSAEGGTHGIYLKANYLKDSVVIKANSGIELYDNNVLKFATTSEGIKITGTTTAAGVLDLYEASNNGVNRISIKSPDTLAANYSLTLPADHGASNEVLTTDGAGVLSWSTKGGGGGGGSPDTPLNSFQFNNGGSFGGADHFEYDSSTGGVKFTDEGSDNTKHLKIYTNNKSYIDVAGGSLEIRLPSDFSNSAIRLKPGSSQSGLNVNYQGSVEAYYSNKKSFETNSTGINVFGDSTSKYGSISIHAAGTGAGKNITIRTPTFDNNDFASSYTLTLPTTAGGSNQVLTTDGAGVLSWTAKGSGGSGATSFTGLSDTPTTYTGQAHKLVRVNQLADPDEADGDKLEFITPLTYSLPASGDSSTVSWTLTASDATQSNNDVVTMTAGANISFETIGQGGFTINSANGAGLGIHESVSDLLEIVVDATTKAAAIHAKDANANKLMFWDDSASKATYLNIDGNTLQINETTNTLSAVTSGGGSGETYTLPLTPVSGSWNVKGDVAIKLTDSSGSAADNQTIKIKNGPGISIVPSQDANTNGAITISSTGSTTDTTYTFQAQQVGESNPNPQIVLINNNDNTDEQSVTLHGGANVDVDYSNSGQITISATAGAGAGVDATVSQVFEFTSGNLDIAGTGPTADRIVYWDHNVSAPRLEFLSIDSNSLEITDAHVLKVKKGSNVFGIDGNITDLLKNNAGDIKAVDGSTDRIMFWDESENKATYLSVGAGLEIDGTTLKGDGTGGKTYTLPTFGTTNENSGIALVGTDESTDTVTIKGGGGITVVSNATDGNNGTTLTIDGSSVTGVVGSKIEKFNTSAEVVDTENGSGHFKVVIDGTEALRVQSNRELLLKKCGSEGAHLDFEDAGGSAEWGIDVVGSGAASILRFIDQGNSKVRFAINKSGAFAVNEQFGGPGQVLQSNGNSSPPTWGGSNTSGAGGATPVGGIIMWNGTVAAIANLVGWALCNGENGTPDLRDKFIVGAGDSYNPGAQGGRKNAIIPSHSHGITDNGHNHNIAHTHSYTDPTIGAYPHLKTDSHGTAVEYPTVNGGTTAAASTNSSGNRGTGISVNSTGSDVTNKNLPPYYALCYIIRLS